MAITQLISRKVGAGDISFGMGSFSYVDENGISHTMQQVNASFIPGSVIKDTNGNVTIVGTLTFSVVGDSIVLNSGGGGVGCDAIGAYIWAVDNSVSIVTGVTGTDTQVEVKHDGIVNITNLPAYVSNEAAIAAGLVAGDLYRILSDPSNNANPSSVCVVV